MTKFPSNIKDPRHEFKAHSLWLYILLEHHSGKNTGVVQVEVQSLTKRDSQDLRMGKDQSGNIGEHRLHVPQQDQ